MPVKKTVTRETELARMAALCNRAEYCEKELADKMKRRGLTAHDIEAVLADLRNARLVDDARFAAAYASTKMRFGGWGHARIKMGLYAKGISGDIVDEALDSLDPEEYEERLRALCISAAKGISEEADTYEGRQKIFRRLAARGFESSLISAVMRSRPWVSDAD